MELFSGVMCILFYLADIFFPLKIEWWFTLAFTENGIYEWNCEGGALREGVFLGRIRIK